MARESTKCFRQRDQPSYHRRVGIEAGFLQTTGTLCFAIPPGEVFRNTVNLFEIQPECLADIAECAFCAIGDNGGGKCSTLAAVFVIDVLNYFFAPFVFEVNVNVGRFITLL